MDRFFVVLLAILCLLYVGISSIVFRKRFLSDPFHPWVVYRYLISYTLVLPVIQSLGDPIFSIETELIILLTAFLFILSLDFVRFFIPSKTNINISNEFKKNDIFYAKSFIVLFIIGWMWRLYALNAGLLYGTFLATQLEISSYGNLFGQLNGLSLLAMLGYSIFIKTSRITKFLVAMILAECIWAFMSGSKIALIYIIFPVLLVAYRRSWINIRPRKLVVGGVLGLMLINVSFGIVTAYRQSVHQAVASGQGLALAAVSEGVVNAFTNFAATQSPPAVSNAGISERLNWAGFYGALIERSDLWHELWLGESYLPIFSWWIPRILWPDKPTVSIGAWYGEHVMGWDYETRSEGAITIWGDALVNFGLGGTFLASLLWIVASYSIYEKIGSRGKWGLLALAMVYVRLLLGIEQNMAAPLVAFQLQIFVIIMIWILLRSGARLLSRDS